MKNLFLLLLATVLFASCGSDNPTNNIIDDDDDGKAEYFEENIYRIEVENHGAYKDFDVVIVLSLFSRDSKPNAQSNYDMEADEEMTILHEDGAIHSIAYTQLFDEDSPAPQKLTYTTSEVYDFGFTFASIKYDTPIPNASATVKVYKDDELVLTKEYEFTEAVNNISITSETK